MQPKGARVLTVLAVLASCCAATDGLAQTRSAVAPPQIVVPDVTQRSEKDARAILGHAKLDVGKTIPRPTLTREGTVVPQGIVVDQDPRGGTRASVGTDVTLFVSTGQPPLTNVPDVTNRPEQQARLILERARLAAGDVARRAALTRDGTVAAQGMVVEQHPRSGAQVPIGTKVALVVGTGQPPFTAVPDVTNHSEQEARLMLRRARLAVGDVGSRAAITREGAVVPQGTVVEQNPRSGAEVSIGTKVALVLSTGVGSVVPPPKPPREQRAAPPDTPPQDAKLSPPPPERKTPPSPAAKTPPSTPRSAAAPPKRPSIVVLSANRTTVAAQDEVTFTISVEPPDPKLEYRVLFGDTEETTWTNTARVTHTYRHKGRYTARAFARESPGAESHSEPLAIDVADPAWSMQTLVGGALLAGLAGTGIYRYAKRRLSLRRALPQFLPNRNLNTVRVETAPPTHLQWQVEFTAVRSRVEHTLVASDEVS